MSVLEVRKLSVYGVPVSSSMKRMGLARPLPLQYVRVAGEDEAMTMWGSRDSCSAVLVVGGGRDPLRACPAEIDVLNAADKVGCTRPATARARSL
mmetsp:Transcript_45746/g.114654  ORF Transcript_45746/g.114654 Transcript_45746/m.114654 type:complete len:95 (+) Transcript_45746:635-919(+)